MVAVRRCTSRTVQDVLRVSLQLAIAYTLVSVVLGAEMCTKSVPVQREPSKKVHVLRRVPASCSQWEKAWSWITKKDCGTKYRLDLVDLPSQKVTTYRVQKTCCEGDTKCKEAEAANGLDSPGLDVSDEKFLAIVLGSTAAALFVLILVISISLCRKKKQCTLLCEERRHIYASAEDDADESSELQGQKGCGGGDDEDETENKVCESEYAEIDASGLPRYTDIFKEEDSSPFTRATAPPITSYESRSGAGAGAGAGAGGGAGWLHAAADETNVKEVLQGTADILQRESKQQQQQHQQKKQQQQQQQRGGGESVEVIHDNAEYYNLSQQQQQQHQQPPLPQSDGGRKKAAAGAAGSGSGLQDEAVLSLTKDDPAVLTASSPPSSPSSSTSSAACPGATKPSPSRKKKKEGEGEEVSYNNSTSCDVNGKGDRCDPLPSPPPSPTAPATTTPSKNHPNHHHHEDKVPSCSPASAYESLAHHGDKDAHEYQRLISRKGKGARAVTEDTEMNGISGGPQVDGGYVDEDDCALNVLPNGHAESAADC